MYKYAASILIILFSISAFSADSRIERWNLRIDRLKKIQAEASSGKADKAVIDDIAGSGINSSTEFLETLKRYKNEDGSLKSGTKKYSLKEIETKVRDISLPAISLYYMSELYKNTGDAKINEKVSADIARHAAQKFGPSFKIPSAEISLTAEHYAIEKGIAEFESAVNSATADLLSKTELELSSSDYNSSDSDLNRIIQKHIEDSLSTIKFSDYSALNGRYLDPVPQWQIITDRYLKTGERNRSVTEFVKANSGSSTDPAAEYDVNSAEKLIFEKTKEKITAMFQNTTSNSGASGNNPYYEIPDLKKLAAAIDDIDSYRKSLSKNITGSENKEQTVRFKSNCDGIAARNIGRIENQFKNEEIRISRLKKIKGNIIIYNEESFNASKTCFSDLKGEIYKYADLSARFLTALYSTGKTDPAKYIEFHRYRSERYIKYISFSEKLTENINALPDAGSAKQESLYRGAIIKVLGSAKNLLRPESIPAEVRASLSKENVKDYASINADFRTNASLHIGTIRKNYDSCIEGFAKAKASDKELAAESEGRIGQDETDRLYSFAKICSEKIASLNYTETALKKYNEEFNRISGELKKGKQPAQFSGSIPESFFGSVPGFSAEAIDREIATREILAREGMEALSGSVTIVQYYKRKGYPVKFTPSNEEINSMKRTFRDSPEITVSSWRMNGKNFRQIDINVAAELKKLINKSAWNGNAVESRTEDLKIYDTGDKVTFTPPSGWRKLQEKGISSVPRISFESPDMKGIIEVTSICEIEKNLPNLAGAWPQRSGFSMTEKIWGKKENSDYIKCTAKNGYDWVMESYMVAKNGYVIILSGKTTGDMYRQMSRTLGDIFTKLEIKESSI